MQPVRQKDILHLEDIRNGVSVDGLQGQIHLLIEMVQDINTTPAILVPQAVGPSARHGRLVIIFRITPQWRWKIVVAAVSAGLITYKRGCYTRLPAECRPIYYPSSKYQGMQ